LTPVKIRVRVFASFREAVGGGALSWDAPEGATVSDVVAALREAYPRLGPAVEKAMLAVNQEYVGGDLRLKDGDELALIPPVSGG
jgi:molybdopterin synthase sulfur carrier subunit